MRRLSGGVPDGHVVNPKLSPGEVVETPRPRVRVPSSVSHEPGTEVISPSLVRTTELWRTVQSVRFRKKYRFGPVRRHKEDPIQKKSYLWSGSLFDIRRKLDILH